MTIEEMTEKFIPLGVLTLIKHGKNNNLVSPGFQLTDTPHLLSSKSLARALTSIYECFEGLIKEQDQIPYQEEFMNVLRV